MNILVTGGTGFIGSHLLHTLIDKKHTVFSLQRKHSNTWRLTDILNTIHSMQYEREEEIPEIFAANQFDGIIHLATHYIKYPASIRDITAMNNSNISFPSMLLEQAIRNNVSFFINTGTCFEFAPTQEKITETTAISPYNYYAATKTAFETLLKFYSEKYKLRALTLKLFYPYGEMDNEKLMVLLIKSILNNTSLEITKGEQLLNYTYVSDIVNAYMAALHAITKGSLKAYETFNIGSDTSVTIKDIVSRLEKIAGKKGDISLTKDYPADEIMHMQADNTKAKTKLQWQPQITIDDGLKRMYDYYQKV